MISVHRGSGARHERAGMADHVASETVREKLFRLTGDELERHRASAGK